MSVGKNIEYSKHCEFSAKLNSSKPLMRTNRLGDNCFIWQYMYLKMIKALTNNMA